VATTAIERKLLLDGQWVETGEWLEVLSPYDGSLVGRVARGGPAETLRGIDAAERAMASPLPAHERAAILDRTAGLIADRADEIARTISAEAGKPMKAARVEVARATSTFTMAAVEARKLSGDAVPMDASPAGVGKLALTLRLPIGVVGAILVRAGHKEGYRVLFHDKKGLAIRNGGVFSQIQFSRQPLTGSPARGHHRSPTFSHLPPRTRPSSESSSMPR